MKKILTVSLFAMMAVSAANADIASTKYVTDRTGDTSAISNIGASKPADLTAAVNALAAELTGISQDTGADLGKLEQEISDLEDSLGSAAYTESSAYATAAQGTKADSAVQTVATGTANGTIAVDGEDVAVKGLGTAAYTASTAYDAAGSAAAAQTAAANALAAAKSELEGKITAASTSAGTNLTNALQNYSTTAQMNTAITNNAVNTVESGSANGTIAVDGEDVAVKGLGSAAYTESSAYATAAQGTKADNAVARTQIGAADNFAITDECKASGAVCSLVVRAGVAGWEKVSY